jgi:hypothetical protein
MPELTNGTPELLPRPDPTDRTTAQLHEAIASLKAQLETRLDGMDIATQLLATTVNHVPSAVDESVGHLKELHDGRFNSLEQMISQRFMDNQKAVDAAFAAQKEAVAEQNKSIALSNDKSELAFTKQIDGQAVLLATTNRAMSDKIEDIKEQLSTRSGHDRGTLDTRTLVLTIVGLILTALLVGAALIGAHL